MISIIIIMIIGIATILYLRSRWGLNKSKTTEIKPDEFKAIDEFSEDEHIEKSFKDVLHSVMMCEDWTNGYGYEELTFIKSTNTNRRIGVSNDFVTLKVKYTIRNKKFKILNIFITTDTVFSYKIENLDLKYYKFFYDTYVDYVNSVNELKRKKVDASLITIKKVIGKESLRDSKIDDILGQ